MTGAFFFYFFTALFILIYQYCGCLIPQVNIKISVYMEIFYDCFYESYNLYQLMYQILCLRKPFYWFCTFISFNELRKVDWIGTRTKYLLQNNSFHLPQNAL